MTVIPLMSEFKKLNVIFGLGLVGIAIALVGTLVDWKKSKDTAEVEAQQIQALPADTK